MNYAKLQKLFQENLQSVKPKNGVKNLYITILKLTEAL